MRKLRLNNYWKIDEKFLIVWRIMETDDGAAWEDENLTIKEENVVCLVAFVLSMK